MSLFAHSAVTADPAHFIDELLQDSMLFVMDVLHNQALKRDAAFYRRGCGLVETLQQRPNKAALSG
ncbi:hypothetical protein [Yersinia sp. 2542 StPb PI]|uniref:hypothetical protein n=1 Tax=Yersinia sp. 2542 StPb PI TaxID=3117408 RepID=UPI003B27EF3A